ncbi:unnamed protein product [Auanema sp. JU1783]|nr:unnamed protein product [Auanema sp. JU1783]
MSAQLQKIHAMLGTESFLFFFQLINNWPSSMIYLWDSTIRPNTHVFDVRYMSSPDNTSDGILQLNSVSEFYRNFGSTVFTVCHEVNDNQNFTFEWQLLRHGVVVQARNGSQCSAQFNLITDDEYQCTLRVRHSNGSITGTGSVDARRESTWIVVIGDSFASGEGNPDTPAELTAPAKWIDDTCRRSRHSFGWLVADDVAKRKTAQSVYLTFLACSGASADRGILKPGNGQLSQLEAIEKMSNARGRGPDLVLMTVGGNDIGFAEVLHSLQKQKKEREVKSFDMRFFFVAHLLDQISSRLRAIGTKRVVLPLYYDITRNEQEVIDASCEQFRKITTNRLAEAERQFFQRLNRLLLRKGLEFGWTVVESIPSIFASRGVCSSISAIRSLDESSRMQGSQSGAFHPNALGHRLVADEILKLIESRI